MVKDFPNHRDHFTWTKLVWIYKPETSNEDLLCHDRTSRKGERERQRRRERLLRKYISDGVEQIDRKLDGRVRDFRMSGRLAVWHIEVAPWFCCVCPEKNDGDRWLWSIYRTLKYPALETLPHPIEQYSDNLPEWGVCNSPEQCLGKVHEHKSWNRIQPPGIKGNKTLFILK